MLHVLPFYVSLLGLLGVVLAVQVISLRRKHKVPLGTGGIEELERAVRAFGNFAEYVPIALILLMAMELAGFGDWWIHVLGMTLLVSRGLHAYALRARSGRLRVMGMVGTFFVIIKTSISLLMM